MAAHPIRSQSNTRTCRDCEGSGEYVTQPYGRPSPYDDVRTCGACNGKGRIEIRLPDVLASLRYFRTYGAKNWMYRQARREAYAPVPLPKSREMRIREAEAFRRAERADCYRQTMTDAVSTLRRAHA